MLNIQQVFTKVAKHLLSQGRKATYCVTEEDPETGVMVEHSECAYRGNDGTACAAGCLIPEKDYRESFEGQKFSYLFIIKALFRPLML